MNCNIQTSIFPLSKVNNLFLWQFKLSLIWYAYFMLLILGPFQSYILFYLTNSVSVFLLNWFCCYIVCDNKVYHYFFRLKNKAPKIILELVLKYAYVCVPKWAHVPHVCSCPWRPEDIRCPGVAVKGSGELPDVSAGKWTWVLCRGRKQTPAQIYFIINIFS